MPDRTPASYRTFTIEHPLLSILFLSVILVAFEFAMYFPPLISWTGRKQEWISYTLIPIIWGTTSGVLLVRSLLHKLWPPLK